MAVQGNRGKQRRLGFAPFFLGAALLGGAAAPIQVTQYLAVNASWLDIDSAYWHGHEMIFGYALAVLGGYLLAKFSWRVLTPLACAWLIARVTVIAGSSLPTELSALLTLVYPIGLFIYGGLPFLRSAKRIRSAIPGLLLGGFVIAELLFQLDNLGILPEGKWRGLMLGFDMIVLLLYLMGGRVIAAATSGAIQKKGGYVAGIAQLKTEVVGLFFLFAMITSDVVFRSAEISGLFAVLSAGVIVKRLIGWRVWTVVDALDISGLHLGYAFLAAGLALKAFDNFAGTAGTFEAMHGIMVGGLGVLSLSIMGRTVVQRARLVGGLPIAIRISIALMALATLLRVAAFYGDLRLEMLIAAATVWASSFAVFSWVVLFALRPQPDKHRA